MFITHNVSNLILGIGIHSCHNLFVWSHECKPRIWVSPSPGKHMEAGKRSSHQASHSFSLRRFFRPIKLNAQRLLPLHLYRWPEAGMKFADSTSSEALGKRRSSRDSCHNFREDRRVNRDSRWLLLGVEDTLHVVHRVTNLLCLSVLVLLSFCSLLFHINCVFCTNIEQMQHPPKFAFAQALQG